MMEQTAPRFDVTPSVSNHFSWLRTRMAVERTFMAWIRTAVSLIGFGFTITQFFARLQDMNERGLVPMGDDVPRNVGLTLIAAGVGALATAAWQYHLGIAYLRTPPFDAIATDSRSATRTPIFVAALILILVGIGAFIAVLFRFT